MRSPQTLVLPISTSIAYHQLSFVLCPGASDHLKRFLAVTSIGELLAVFAKLVRKGLVGHSLELDSANDPKIHELLGGSAVNDNNLIGWFVVYGEPEIRRPKNELIRKELAPYLSEVRIYESEDHHEAAALPVQVGLDRYRGQPNDHSLTASAKAFGVNIDGQDGELDIDLYDQMPGFRCILPVLPFSSNLDDNSITIKKQLKHFFDPIHNLYDQLEYFGKKHQEAEENHTIGISDDEISELPEEYKEAMIVAVNQVFDQMYKMAANWAEA